MQSHSQGNAVNQGNQAISPTTTTNNQHTPSFFANQSAHNTFPNTTFYPTTTTTTPQTATTTTPTFSAPSTNYHVPAPALQALVQQTQVLAKQYGQALHSLQQGLGLHGLVHHAQQQVQPHHHVHAVPHTHSRLFCRHSTSTTPGTRRTSSRLTTPSFNTKCSQVSRTNYRLFSSSRPRPPRPRPSCLTYQSSTSTRQPSYLASS